MARVKLIDVGARGGADERWIPFAADIEVIAFEPDRTECDRLNGLEFPYPIRFLPYALGRSDGEQAMLRIFRKLGCSSLLKPNETLCSQYHYAPHMEVAQEIPVTLSRLDSVCSEQPDVMKIDTQGTELDVLHGAGDLLAGTLAVELEVEFIEQYEDQTLFGDIDVFMRSSGFTLRGLRRTYWRERGPQTHPFGGQLVHGDVFYIRRDRINCPKGHTILAAYRQYDMLAKFGASHLIPNVGFLRRFGSRLLGGFPNRELRRLVDKLRPADAVDWHDPDFF